MSFADEIREDMLTHSGAEAFGGQHIIDGETVQCMIRKSKLEEFGFQDTQKNRQTIIINPALIPEPAIRQYLTVDGLRFQVDDIKISKIFLKIEISRNFV